MFSHHRCAWSAVSQAGCTLRFESKNAGREVLLLAQDCEASTPVLGLLSFDWNLIVCEMIICFCDVQGSASKVLKNKQQWENNFMRVTMRRPCCPQRQYMSCTLPLAWHLQCCEHVEWQKTTCIQELYFCKDPKREIKVTQIAGSKVGIPSLLMMHLHVTRGKVLGHAHCLRLEFGWSEILIFSRPQNNWALSQCEEQLLHQQYAVPQMATTTSILQAVHMVACGYCCLGKVCSHHWIPKSWGVFITDCVRENALQVLSAACLSKVVGWWPRVEVMERNDCILVFDGSNWWISSMVSLLFLWILPGTTIYLYGAVAGPEADPLGVINCILPENRKAAWQEWPDARIWSVVLFAGPP